MAQSSQSEGVCSSIRLKLDCAQVSVPTLKPNHPPATMPCSVPYCLKSKCDSKHTEFIKAEPTTPWPQEHAWYYPIEHGLTDDQVRECGAADWQTARVAHFLARSARSDCCLRVRTSSRATSSAAAQLSSKLNGMTSFFLGRVRSHG